MPAIFAFITGPLVKALAPVLLVIVIVQHIIINGLPIVSDLPLVGGLFPQGLKQELADERAARAKERDDALIRLLAATKAARAWQANADEITKQADIDAAIAADRENRPARIIRDEIPVFITPEIDEDFPVPVSFVRLFDAAASGSTLTATASAVYPGFPNDSESELTMSQVGTVLADNFRECRVNFAQTKESWRVWGEEMDAWAQNVIEQWPKATGETE